MLKKAIRQKEILSRLTVNSALRVRTLANALSVTTETIRRDLEEMADQGLLSRTYGGAVLRQPSEPVLTSRQRIYVDEREAIARAVVPLMKGSRVLMLGSGATTAIVAKRIASEMNDVTVLSHSFAVAIALAANRTIRIVMAPGDYHAGEGATFGTQTLRFLQNYTADWAVLGASALSPDGPSDALIEAADIYAAMLQQSARQVIVADHSKFDRIATACYANWSEIDTLVSDQAPHGLLARALKRNAVTVVTADS